jgi:hypothetical protein
MSWQDSAKGMAGAPKAPRKQIREIRTRKGKSGGYIHEHHHMAPEHHPMEEHTSPDQDAMVQHMMQNMGSPSPSASPDGSDSASIPTGAPTPGASAPIAGGAPTPGAM